jgi:hypothetical protein
LLAQDWKLRKSNEHIKVFSSTEPNSEFDIIKVEAVLDGTIQKLVAILKDVSNNNKWVYKTRRSYLIDSINADEFLYYAETAVPWPFSNRDMVIKMLFMPDTINKKLIVQATGIPKAIPEKQGLVRISKFDGYWQVMQESNNKITINYLLKVDPGGSIPPGISNLFVSNGPFETFNNLARILKQ